MGGLGAIFVIVLILLVILAIKCVKVVPEGYEWIVEDLGRKRDITLKPGLSFILPFYV